MPSNTPMITKEPFSPLQQEYFMNATHRWNVKTGATRSGKTYMDLFVIPKRVINTHGDGLIVLLGNTNTTIARNILDPMRNIWGQRLIGYPGSNNTVQIFGKKCYVLGADKVSQVKRLQGSGIEYCYGDEVATWHEDVFAMLKSRLDKPNSIFDGTCNPDNPNHWFKKFLDSGADIYKQSYTIDDNPYLSPEFVASLKKEYEGTVYYERFILGKWQAAEGVIYRRFADDPEKYTVGNSKCTLKVLPDEFMIIEIGVDFGGTGSGTAFVATGYTEGYRQVIALESERHMGEIDPDELGRLFVDFVSRVINKYGRADYADCDSAEQILIRGLKKSAQTAGLPTTIRNAVKKEINDRIRLAVRLIAQERLFVTDRCETLKKALSEARWSGKIITKDERLDDGSSDIDTMDAFEYTLERYSSRLIDF